MEVKSLEAFNSHLDDAIERYPSLRIKSSNGQKYLKGILDIPDDNGAIIGAFSVEIHYKQGYPKRFPIIKEVGESIPDEADWHKYPDGQCCITVPPMEILFCRHGISLIHFIERHAIPYFANHIYRVHFGKYKNGEYSHGKFGIREFYARLLKVESPLQWKEIVDHAFGKGHLAISRNEKCFCGSGLKFKKCHDQVFYELQMIGEAQVRHDLKLNTA